MTRGLCRAVMMSRLMTDQNYDAQAMQDKKLCEQAY